jgi:hypothetical protein
MPRFTSVDVCDYSYEHRCFSMSSRQIRDCNLVRRSVFMLGNDFNKACADIIVCTKGRVKMYCVLVICYLLEE